MDETEGGNKRRCILDRKAEVVAVEGFGIRLTSPHMSRLSRNFLDDDIERAPPLQVTDKTNPGRTKQSGAPRCCKPTQGLGFCRAARLSARQARPSYNFHRRDQYLTPRSSFTIHQRHQKHQRQQSIAS